MDVSEKMQYNNDDDDNDNNKWNVKTKMIPAIIRATGTISKSFIKYLRNITEKYEIKEH
jgi:hypothetical protein